MIRGKGVHLLAACIKLNYKRCIAIVVIIFVSYYTFVIWNKINSNSKGKFNSGLGIQVNKQNH